MVMSIDWVEDAFERGCVHYINIFHNYIFSYWLVFQSESFFFNKYNIGWSFFVVLSGRRRRIEKLNLMV